MIKMRKYFILGLFLVLFGCSSKQTLELSTPTLTGELSLVPRFQQLPDQSRTVYQEISEGESQVLDSLIIEEEALTVPLVAYVQQNFNQLRLHGYELSDEITQKQTLKIWSQSSEALAILKTYRIRNMLWTQLYAAQYHIELWARVLIISYASDRSANRKAFLESLSQLSFNL